MASNGLPLSAVTRLVENSSAVSGLITPSTPSSERISSATPAIEAMLSVVNSSSTVAPSSIVTIVIIA